MDTSDPKITFDSDRVCNHCKQYLKNKAAFIHPEQFNATIEKLKKGRCIIGMSGGVDSSYVAMLLGNSGIKPYIVTFDNGYNTKISEENVSKVLKHFKWSMEKHSVDYKEFASMQLAYLDSGVLNIESISDHAIYAVLWNTAKQIGAKYVVSGSNYATEGILPRAWSHNGADLDNIISICKANGLNQLPKSYPTLPPKIWTEYRKTIEQVDLLNFTDYKSQTAKRELAHIGWTDYGAKHCESIITRFYQRYILPTRTGIDKRRAHLSCLVMNGEMTREQALAELSRPAYTTDEFREDKEFITHYLELTARELEELIRQPVKSYAEFQPKKSLLARILGR